VLRISWKFEWVSKPWVGAGQIEDTSEIKIRSTIAYIFKDYMPSAIRKFTQARDAARGETDMLKNLSEIQDEISDLRTYMHHSINENSDTTSSQIATLT